MLLQEILKLNPVTVWLVLGFYKNSDQVPLEKQKMSYFTLLILLILLIGERGIIHHFSSHKMFRKLILQNSLKQSLVTFSWGDENQSFDFCCYFSHNWPKYIILQQFLHYVKTILKRLHRPAQIDYLMVLGQIVVRGSSICLLVYLHKFLILFLLDRSCIIQIYHNSIYFFFLNFIVFSAEFHFQKNQIKQLVINI